MQTEVWVRLGSALVTELGELIRTEVESAKIQRLTWFEGLGDRPERSVERRCQRLDPGCPQKRIGVLSFRDPDKLLAKEELLDLVLGQAVHPFHERWLGKNAQLVPKPSNLETGRTLILESCGSRPVVKATDQHLFASWVYRDRVASGKPSRRALDGHDRHSKDATDDCDMAGIGTTLADDRATRHYPPIVIELKALDEQYAIPDLIILRARADPSGYEFTRDARSRVPTRPGSAARVLPGDHQEPEPDGATSGKTRLPSLQAISKCFIATSPIVELAAAWM